MNLILIGLCESGKKSQSQWLEGLLKDHGIDFLISRFEGGGLLYQPTLRDLTGPFSVRATLQWMDLLLAVLDCYNTFIGLPIIKPQLILGNFCLCEYVTIGCFYKFFCFVQQFNRYFLPDSTGSKDNSFLKATHFFLTELAVHGLTAAESCFPHGERTSHFSPREVDQYNYSKCTIVVRLLEFASMILDKGDQGIWKRRCVSRPLWGSTWLTWSVEDLCEVDLYHPGTLNRHDQTEMVLSSCKQIHRAGFLSSILHSQLVELLLNTIMLSVPVSGGHSHNFLSFSHGEYFYSLFQTTINSELLRNLEAAVPRLMKASSENPSMSQALLVLPFFTTLQGEPLAGLQKALDTLVASHFPMQSDEFAKGSLHRNNYMDCIRKLLCAVYEVIQQGDVPASAMLQAMMERVLLPLASQCSTKALSDFFVTNVCEIIGFLQSRFTKVRFLSAVVT
ncbi:hypothetical protein GOODEAATRI_010272 [Goodea atripinnis]|uniref:DNA-dependent protein kinase catalytic subunit CC1/2 domain-containing protein n=1 Tax=Goodea atripinnis TaxID=208336 RepID=A0ABV0PWT6_9TELE